jgi:predicted dehydrogenase
MAANLMHGFGDAEDNATMLLRFPAATALLEASWTTFHNGVAGGPILYGTHGTIVVDGADVLVYRERASRAPSAIEQGDPLPPGRATIGEEFLHHLETGEPLHPTLALPLNLAATAMLDAGRRAAATGIAQVPGAV